MLEVSSGQGVSIFCFTVIHFNVARTSLEIVIRLAAVYDISRFTRPLFRSLAATLVSDDKAGPALSFFAKQQPNLPKPSTETFRNLTQAIFEDLTQRTKEEDQVDLPPQAVEILSLVKQAYPQILVDAASENHASATKIAFAINVFQSRGSIDSPHALLMGMHDADANVRKDFYLRVLENPTALDKGQLRLIVDSLLQDDSSVVSSILSSMDLTKLEPEYRSDQILAACTRVIANDATPKAIIIDHVRLLTKNLSSNVFGPTHQILVCLWPRLLYTKTNKKTCISIWQELLWSSLAAEGSLLQGITVQGSNAEELNSAIAKSLARNILAQVNQEEMLKFLVSDLQKASTDSSALSLLVLLAIVQAHDCPTDLVNQILQHLSAHQRDLTNVSLPFALFDGAEVSKQLLSLIYTKNKSAKASSALRLCILASGIAAWVRRIDMAAVWSDSLASVLPLHRQDSVCMQTSGSLHFGARILQNPSCSLVNAYRSWPKHGQQWMIRKILSKSCRQQVKVWSLAKIISFTFHSYLDRC